MKMRFTFNVNSGHALPAITLYINGALRHILERPTSYIQHHTLDEYSSWMKRFINDVIK